MPSRVKEVGGGRRKKEKVEERIIVFFFFDFFVKFTLKLFYPFFLMLLHFFRQLKKLRERERKETKRKGNPIETFPSREGEERKSMN